MASQWPAIIGTLSGTLIGTSIGVASTWVLERTRWDRQRSERLEENRRELYGKYIGHMNGMFDLLQEMNDTINRTPPGGTVTDDEFSALYRPVKLAAVECASTLGEIRLVSSPEVVTIADRWFEGRAMVLDSAVAYVQPTGWKEAVDRWSDDRDTFTKVARKELSTTA